MSTVATTLDNGQVTLAQRKALRVILEPLFIQLANAIKEQSPVATGALSGSFVAVIGGEDQIVYEVGSPLWGKPKGYGQYPEFGTKPHWMPIAPLLTWVREKFSGKVGMKKQFQARQKLSGRKSLKAFDYDREVMSMARAIQVSIHLKGTKAQRYVARVLQAYDIPYQEIHTAMDSYYSADVSKFISDDNLNQKIRGYLN